MSDTITLSAKKREILGRKVSQLRAQGQTPAVVHDHGKSSLHIALSEVELKKVFSRAGKHSPVKLNIDGKNYTTLIKEVTYKPASTQLYHSVFQAVSANETVKAEVPLHLVGEIPAERQNLLVLKSLEHVEVEALPSDLVDAIEVDAGVLAEVGDKITVADLKVPSGVNITTDPEQMIATVEMPRDQIAEADAALAEIAEQEGAATEEGEDTAGEAEAVPSEHGTESDEGSEGEIRPGGKKEFEDKDQGHNPTQK